MIGSSKWGVRFFFCFARVVSFCRNNYHGSASQQRENIARGHCIYHALSSSFSAGFSRGLFNGRKRQPEALGKAWPLTKQAARSPEAGWRECCRSWCSQLLTKYIHPQPWNPLSQTNSLSLQQQMSWCIGHEANLRIVNIINKWQRHVMNSW